MAISGLYWSRGAQILLNGVTLRLTGSACIIAEPFPLAQQVFANGFSQDVIVTDAFRVKLIGVGTIDWMIVHVL